MCFFTGCTVLCINLHSTPGEWNHSGVKQWRYSEIHCAQADGYWILNLVFNGFFNGLVMIWTPRGKGQSHCWSDVSHIRAEGMSGCSAVRGWSRWQRRLERGERDEAEGGHLVLTHKWRRETAADGQSGGGGRYPLPPAFIRYLFFPAWLSQSYTTSPTWSFQSHINN